MNLSQFLKCAMDFPNQEALRKYLEEHPNADRKNHRVVEIQKNRFKTDTFEDVREQHRKFTKGDKSFTPRKLPIPMKKKLPKQPKSPDRFDIHPPRLESAPKPLIKKNMDHKSIILKPPHLKSLPSKVKPLVKKISELIQSNDYKPLQYLLTLPLMSKIQGISENKLFSFVVFGKKGLYRYPDRHQQEYDVHEQLTISELIKILPPFKYSFDIEFEQEEKDIFKELILLREINKRKDTSNKIKELESQLSPEKAYKYASEIIHDRLENESVLLKDLPDNYHYPFLYAENVIKGRFPLLEEIILNKSYAKLAFKYAKNIIKDPWSEAESIISQNGDSAYLYVRDIIKERWVPGEKTILNSIHRRNYLKFISRNYLYKLNLGNRALSEYIDIGEKIIQKYQLRGLSIAGISEKDKLPFALHWLNEYLNKNPVPNYNPASPKLEKFKKALHLLDEIKDRYHFL